MIGRCVFVSQTSYTLLGIVYSAISGLWFCNNGNLEKPNGIEHYSLDLNPGNRRSEDLLSRIISHFKFPRPCLRFQRL